ncbi:MAG: hypothetical protein KatS3mg096_623 [Candidatus Parcubacteria bacterium]|nr:MAG: hypothetical protein KatS3mg096_623 [Candidatus Parcubacteria bacterium]
MKNNEYKANIVFHPSETLKEKLNELNYSLEYFSQISDIDLDTLKKFMCQKIDIDKDIAKKLEKSTKISGRFWLNLQKLYDEYKSKK